MWKDFSRSYLARNRAAGWTVAAAALAAAFFLSLLCSLAYNLWVYEIRRITQEKAAGTPASPWRRTAASRTKRCKS